MNSNNDTPEFTAEQLAKQMQLQMFVNAKECPWGWEWKFIQAAHLLSIGRDIKFVKDTLGVTYRWLIQQGMIKWIDIRNKKGEVVDRKLVPVA